MKNVSIIEEKMSEESAETNELGIICPLCNDIVIAVKEGDELRIKKKCSCLGSEIKEQEWFEMIYRLWDDFSVIQIPEGIDFKEEEDV